MLTPGPPPAPHPLATSRLFLAILGSLTAVSPLAIDLYLPALPALGRDLQASAAVVGLTLTSCLVGLGIGQLLAGPLSDRLGRRTPLLWGLVLYTVTSALCGVAESAAALIAVRFLQGLAGAGSIVIARAAVRDVCSGEAAARAFSVLMLILGAAPILAPVVGAGVLELSSWRGTFAVLAALGAVQLVVVAVALPETLPADRRQRGGAGHMTRTLGRLLTEREFCGYALSCGLAFGSMFAYIAGSPFVLQDVFGLSPVLYAVVFGFNALGLIALSQLNGWLVYRIAPARLLGWAVATTAVGGLLLLAVTLVGGLGVAPTLVALFVVVTSLGAVIPNATALALERHPAEAGSAAALLGAIPFVVGAAVAPLVGVAGEDTAVPMALTMALLGVGALAGLVGLAGRPR